MAKPDPFIVKLAKSFEEDGVNVASSTLQLRTAPLHGVCRICKRVFEPSERAIRYKLGGYGWMANHRFQYACADRVACHDKCERDRSAPKKPGKRARDVSTLKDAVTI